MNFILDSDLLVAQENTYTCVVDPADSIKGHIWYVFLGTEVLCEGHEDTMDKAKLACENAYREHYKENLAASPDTKSLVEAAGPGKIAMFLELSENLVADVAKARDSMSGMMNLMERGMPIKLSPQTIIQLKELFKHLRAASEMIYAVHDEIAFLRSTSATVVVATLSRLHKAAFVAALMELEGSNEDHMTVMEKWHVISSKLDKHQKISLDSFLDSSLDGLDKPQESWKIQEKAKNKEFPKKGLEKLLIALGREPSQNMKKYLPADSELLKKTK